MRHLLGQCSLPIPECKLCLVIHRGAPRSKIFSIVKGCTHATNSQEICSSRDWVRDKSKVRFPLHRHSEGGKPTVASRESHFLEFYFVEFAVWFAFGDEEAGLGVEVRRIAVESIFLATNAFPSGVGKGKGKSAHPFSTDGDCGAHKVWSSTL